MTDRELMQQALDALEGYARNCRCEGGGAPCDAAEALRARLAQPELEPLAWWQPNEYKIEKSFSWHKKGGFIKPLYTAPPQREWQGLTDEEVRDLWSWSMTAKAERTANTQQHAFARAIEAKLKEKNT